MVCLFRNRHLQIDWAIITDISSGFKRKNLLLPKTTKINIFKCSTAQFGKRHQREILFQDKVWKTQEYFVYFKFFKPQYWDKRSADVRRRNCVVLP